MNKIVSFLVVLYVVSLAGGWAWHVKTSQAQIAQNNALIETLKQSNTKVLQDLALQKTETSGLKKKIADSHEYASFLALGLCPTLEATNKEALCVKNSTEWFAQTIESGTILSDQEAKDGMTKLVLSLTVKKKPTAKQIYESLKPVQVRALKVLTENLK
jgi:hypothetical protein